MEATIKDKDRKQVRLLFEIVKRYRKYFEDIEEDLAAQLLWMS